MISGLGAAKQRYLQLKSVGDRGLAVGCISYVGICNYLRKRARRSVFVPFLLLKFLLLLFLLRVLFALNFAEAARVLVFAGGVSSLAYALVEGRLLFGRAFRIVSLNFSLSPLVLSRVAGFPSRVLFFRLGQELRPGR